tara:strand:- start:747 stop:1655 length:909 start_codon:yes stop_codon:yes gene_type:complete
LSFDRFFTSSILAALIAVSPADAAGPDSSHDSACALAIEAPADAEFSLPFRTVDGRIYLDAMVDGEGPFAFALDTGASGMGRADATLVDALNLPADGMDETSDGVSSSQVDKVRIASLTLGGLERRDLSVIARDYRSRVSAEAAFSGILGREFFADGLLAIDFSTRRLTFYRSREMPASLRDATTYERAFRIPVTIGDFETTGNVDTGANVTMVVPGTVFSEVEGTAAGPAGGGSLTNTRIDIFDAELAGPVRIGGVRLENIPVKVAADYPEVLIGAHALQGHVVLIDQRHSTLAICKSAAP